MENITITSVFAVCPSVDELPQDVKALMLKAFEARDNAYAPYSRFHVGAALLMANGAVVIGSNQENAAYPSGLCAERVAIFQAGALYPGVAVAKMAISAASQTKPVESPIPPCGACRQSIGEYELRQNEPIEIWFMGETGKVYKSESLKNLLPMVFGSEYL